LNDFPALEDGDDIQDAEVIEEDIKEVIEEDIKEE
jgi:hypothetical protein